MSHSVKTRSLLWLWPHLRNSAALIGLAPFLGELVHAQSTHETDSAGGIEPVVVTAERRTEDSQRVPISAVVYSGSSLAETNQNSLPALTQTTPAVFINLGGPSNSIFIRGIGSSGNQSFDQSVGLFIDDVYHGRSRTSDVTVMDIDRIEVLKGPQSTYFGNNAIAGAISIITKKPGDTLEADARALYGEHGDYAAEGAVGGPLTDTIGLRVAATYNGSDGWIDNVNTGEKVPRTQNLGGRMTLAFDAASDLSVIWKLEVGRHHDLGAAYGTPMQIAYCPAPAAWTRNQAFCKAAIAQNLPIGLNNSANADAAGQGDWLSTTDAAMTVNYERWGQKFAAATGFYHYNYNFDLQADGTPTTTRTVDSPETFHQFSQEIRVASDGHQQLEYIGGAYFQTSKLLYAPGNVIYSATVPHSDPLHSYLPLGSENVVTQNENSYAAFAAVTWHAERLSLTAGMRETQDSKDFHRVYQYGTAEQFYGDLTLLPTAALQAAAASLPAFQGLQASTVDLSRTDRGFLPSGKMAFDLSDDVMVYASYSRGFKAGGFNGVDTTGNVANIPFAPEYVNSYETGIKSQWLGNTLHANFALFRSDYSNLQAGVVTINSAGTVSSFVRNAAASRSQGVEMEMQWRPDSHFSLAANLSYLNSYYISYPDAGPTNSQTYAGIKSQNISGQPTMFAPRWSGNVHAAYCFILPDNERLTLSFDPFFTSSYKLRDTDETINGVFYYGQDGYIRLEAGMTLDGFDHHFAFDIIGRNLNNRIVITAFGSALTAATIEHRSIVAQVRFKW